MLNMFSLLLFILFLSGCVNQDSLKSISINGQTQISVGIEAIYSVNFDPIDYKNQNIIWQSSDENILSSLGNGKFIANQLSDSVYIVAISEADSNITASLEIKIVAVEVSNIDLGGYTIKMGYNKYYESYKIRLLSLLYDDYDSTFAKAVAEIESKYNCSIIQTSMGDGDLQTGIFNEEKLISDIKTNIKNNNYDFDFIMVPVDYYNDFINEQLVINIENYKADSDDKLNTTGSKLLDSYAVNPAMNYQTYYLVYNTELLETLGISNSPIDLFNEGKWTDLAFYEYCSSIEKLFKEKYGDKGLAGSSEQEYYVVGGMYSALWAGMQSTIGKAIVDTSKGIVNLNSTSYTASIVKQLHKDSLIFPYDQYIHLNNSWNENKILFATINLGELKNLYSDVSNGSSPKFAYVPWPSSIVDESSTSNYNYCVSNIANSWFMVTNREDDYNNYSKDCTTENIYFVISELSKLIKEECSVQYIPSNCFENKDFIEQKMKSIISNSYIYVDPILSDNHYTSLGILENGTGINAGLYQHIIEDKSWDEAMSSCIQELQEILNKEKN